MVAEDLPMIRAPMKPRAKQVSPIVGVDADASEAALVGVSPSQPVFRIEMLLSARGCR